MSKPLAEVAKLFFKLGCIGFGGPAVHIAMMEEEVVRKRGWMTHQHFLDLVGATNLIPGPNSTEMTMHCGHERAGWKGLIVAGCCFIIPAVIITAAIAWAYQRYGQLPEVNGMIYGIKPAIISVILVAMIHLGKKAFKSVTLGLIGALSILAVFLGVHEIIVFFSAGVLGVAVYILRSRKSISCLFPFTLLQIVNVISDPGHIKLFWIFLKIGSILYGSGYVLFAFLDAELVSRNLLSKQQLLDAIAVGQFTPGPLFSAATFVGWQVGGLQGAIAATLGIFLPSFLFVALLNPLIPKLRKSGIMSAFLDTINVVAVCLILSVLIEMSSVTLTNWRSIVIAVISFGVTFSFRKINTAFIVLGGALFGYLLSFYN